METNLEMRKIPSLKFLYEISEDGRIFRNVKSKKQNKIILDKHHSEKGYYATFIHINGRRYGSYTKRLMIHQLVAECWLGKCPDDMEVDHIDRNPHNNHYSNLRYVTHSEQMKNRVLSDRMKQIATANCMQYVYGVVAKPCTIRSGNEEHSFISMADCSKYLGKRYSVSAEKIRSKLKQRRKHIYDFDIDYRIAETVRSNPTG